jgi:hypothetical protein
VSSVVTIGFLDRTHACVQTAYALPLADDERRELLIHIAFFTARMFAALPAERQLSFAGVLRDWIGQGFASCPLQLASTDPGGGLPRFASSFQAPTREYALATNGCAPGENGIEYFFPMATAAFLRHVGETDHDPAELFKPALALCAAVVIHPVTVATHFQIAAASLPKVGPPLVRRSSEDSLSGSTSHHAVAQAEAALSAQHLRETRKTLVASAVLALLMVVGVVQYLSTRVPEAGNTMPPVVEAPPPAAPTSPLPDPVTPMPVIPPPDQTLTPTTAEPSPENPAPIVEAAPPAAGPPSVPPVPGPRLEASRPAEPAPRSSALATASPKGSVYRRALRDLAESSLAQVEVMLAAVRRQDNRAAGLGEVLEYGMRQTLSRQRRFEALTPPPALEENHHEVKRILADLTGLAKELHEQAPMTPLASRLASERLAQIHARIDEVMDIVESY